MNREAREGWLSACFSLPQCLLPQLSTHSRVSAGMCSLSLRDFMLRPGPRVCGRVPTLPSWLPGPLFCSIRPTDRRRHGDSKLGGSSGRAAWGLGRRGGGLFPPRGGARSPAPVRRPSVAGAVRVQEAGAAGATPSQRGTPGLPGPRPMDCAVGKIGQSQFLRPASLHHRLAPPLPCLGPRPPQGSPGPGSEHAPAPVSQLQH